MYDHLLLMTLRTPLAAVANVAIDSWLQPFFKFKSIVQLMYQKYKLVFTP